MYDRKHIFISYSSKDADKAFIIKETLESNGIICWMAPDSIPAGSDYSSEITNGIENSYAFILLLSKNAIESKYVIKELIHAIDHDVRVVPLRTDDHPLGKSFSFQLNNIQMIPAEGDIRACITDLLKLGMLDNSEKAITYSHNETAAPSNYEIKKPDVFVDSVPGKIQQLKKEVFEYFRDNESKLQRELIAEIKEIDLEYDKRANAAANEFKSKELRLQMELEQLRENYSRNIESEKRRRDEEIDKCKNKVAGILKEKKKWRDIILVEKINDLLINKCRNENNINNYIIPNSENEIDYLKTYLNVNVSSLYWGSQSKLRIVFLINSSRSISGKIMDVINSGMKEALKYCDKTDDLIIDFVSFGTGVTVKTNEFELLSPGGSESMTEGLQILKLHASRVDDGDTGFAFVIITDSFPKRERYDDMIFDLTNEFWFTHSLKIVVMAGRSPEYACASSWSQIQVSIDKNDKETFPLFIDKVCSLSYDSFLKCRKIYEIAKQDEISSGDIDTWKEILSMYLR